MKFIFSLSLLLTFWLPSSAQRVAGDSNKTGQSAASLKPVITYEFSEGPAYKIYISSDRTLVYEGIEGVKTKGKITTKITDIQFQQLMEAFKNAGFSSLRNSYNLKNGCTSGTSDSAWVTITLRSGTSVKSIDHYLGCYGGNTKFVRGLTALTRLEKRIHNILNIEQWIGTEEERSMLPDPRLILKKR